MNTWLKWMKRDNPAELPAIAKDNIKSMEKTDLRLTYVVCERGVFGKALHKG